MPSVYNTAVQPSQATPFDNTTNGFIADNAQAAIEESVNLAVAKARFTIVVTFNGTIGNNQWLGYSELIPGDQVPIRIPIACKLKEITFSYQDTLLGGASIDGQFDLYKNGFTKPANVIHTEQFTNQNNGKIATGLNLTFAANDFMVGRWVDQGDNPSDMAIVYFFEVL